MLIQKSVLIGYSATRMFDLVQEIHAYPEFLPWCSGASATTVSTDEHHVEQLVATLKIDYRGLHQSFTTENRQKRAEYIEMRLREGPFRVLEGVWRFLPLGEDACKIEFQLHYEFASHLLSALIVPVFNHIAGSFVESFVKRAEYLYD